VKRVAIVALGLIVAALAATVRIVPASEPTSAAQAGTSGWAIPVAGVTSAQLENNWQDAREGGARVHEGIDITAPRGTPVLSATAGRVEKLFISERGGITLYVRSSDGASMTYYAHLAGYYPGIAEGQIVRKGQQIAFVGDTGDAGAGNFHLHFAVNSMAKGDRWWQGTPVNPYPLLAANRAER